MRAHRRAGWPGAAVRGGAGRRGLPARYRAAGPLQTAGFRYQRFHPFGLDRDHLYAWIEGGPYTGSKPHRTAALRFCSAGEASRRLREHGEPVLAAAVPAAAESYRTLDEQAFYADIRRTLEPAYLRGTTPQQGSGFGGDEREWEQARRHITEGIAGDGTFLDVGCAGQTSGGDRPGRPPTPTAWITADPAATSSS